MQLTEHEKQSATAALGPDGATSSSSNSPRDRPPSLSCEPRGRRNLRQERPYEGCRRLSTASSTSCVSRIDSRLCVSSCPTSTRGSRSGAAHRAAQTPSRSLATMMTRPPPPPWPRASALRERKRIDEYACEYDGVDGGSEGCGIGRRGIASRGSGRGGRAPEERGSAEASGWTSAVSVSVGC